MKVRQLRMQYAFGPELRLEGLVAKGARHRETSQPSLTIISKPDSLRPPKL